MLTSTPKTHTVGLRENIMVNVSRTVKRVTLCWRERAVLYDTHSIYCPHFLRKEFENVIEIPLIPTHWIWCGCSIKNEHSLCICWPLSPAVGNRGHLWTTDIQLRAVSWRYSGAALFIPQEISVSTGGDAFVTCRHFSINWVPNHMC